MDAIIFYIADCVKNVNVGMGAHDAMRIAGLK